MWLVLPIFNGAAYIYGNIVRKYVNIGTYLVNSPYPESQRKVLEMMSLDARKSVERYIDRHGPDAFDRVIKAVINNKNNNFSISFHILMAKIGEKSIALSLEVYKFLSLLIICLGLIFAGRKRSKEALKKLIF